MAAVWDGGASTVTGPAENISRRDRRAAAIFPRRDWGRTPMIKSIAAASLFQFGVKLEIREAL
jgi:hypothetical protein